VNLSYLEKLAHNVFAHDDVEVMIETGGEFCEDEYSLSKIICL
jgi:hypothetical protein